ncbi:MAG TPA: dethiobiotin synthase [Candidatus Acidoferrum sp.]|nr:dethiobiotin synthase [Candidatus Acidoferrum sp.]
MTPSTQPRVIFITGTDTGVGKTVLTSLLLCYLRRAGCRALAMKPFCSGSRADAKLLHALQDGELTLDELNPFYFPEPVAPVVAARKDGRSIRLRDVLARIQAVASREVAGPKSKINQNVLIIEGSGGLLVPLAEGFDVRALIRSLRCEVLVVARNRLGTINHTLLTVQALQTTALHAAHVPQRASRPPPSRPKVVLMNPRTRDYSSSSNAAILTELLSPVPLLTLPFLGPRCCTPTAIKKSVPRAKETLEQILF